MAGDERDPNIRLLDERSFIGHMLQVRHSITGAVPGTTLRVPAGTSGVLLYESYETGTPPWRLRFKVTIEPCSDDEWRSAPGLHLR